MGRGRSNSLKSSQGIENRWTVEKNPTCVNYVYIKDRTQDELSGGGGFGLKRR